MDEILYHGAPILDADTFYTDADGLVWIGTIGNGLLLVDHGKVSVYSMGNGLYDNEIFGIVGDSQDRLWFTCTKGLYSVNRADLRRLAAGELKNFASTPYNSMDSMNAVEGKSGSQPAILRTHDGRIWFSTNRGLVAFDPNRHQRESSVPPVAIEQVIVNGQISKARTLAKLPPGEKNLEFRYTGIDFTRPARMIFRYKLEGYDKDWIDAGMRRESLLHEAPSGTIPFPSDRLYGRWDLQHRWCASRLRSGISVLPAIMVPSGMLIAHRPRNLVALQTEGSSASRTLFYGFGGAKPHRAGTARYPHPWIVGPHDASPGADRSWPICRGQRGPGGDYSRRCSVYERNPSVCSGAPLCAKIEIGHCHRDWYGCEANNKRYACSPQTGTGGTNRSLPADVEYNLLYIAREAVSNSVRHSGAHTIEVVLAWADEQLQLIIKDDGMDLIASMPKIDWLGITA